MDHLKRNTTLFGLKMSTPILIGYMFLGFAYGVLMQQQGLAFIWTFLTSTLVFAGALQYAVVPMMTAAFDPITVFILALSINIRHFFYGISIFDKYKEAGKIMPVLVYTMADEAFSINASTHLPKSLDPPRFYLTVSILGYSYWVMFTSLGHLFASTVTITVQGLDFVLPALFFALFLNMWKQTSKRKTMLFGVGATILSMLMIRNHLFVLASMIIIFVGLTIETTKEQRHE